MAREVERKRPVVRFIGLLHDLTHAPFGHTVEEEIKLMDSKHDEPSRQADAFYRLVCQLAVWLASDAGLLEGESRIPPTLLPFLGGGHEHEPPETIEAAKASGLLLSGVSAERAAASWRLTHRELATLFAQLDAAMTALLHLEVLHKSKIKTHHLPDPENSFQVALRQGLASTRFADHGGE